MAALLAAVALVLVRCVPPLGGSGDGEGEGDGNDFCFYAAETRTLALAAQPDPDAITILPLALDGLVRTAPAEVRADAQLLLDAAGEVQRTGSTAPLLAAPVQAARERLVDEAARRCR